MAECKAPNLLRAKNAANQPPSSLLVIAEQTTAAVAMETVKSESTAHRIILGLKKAKIRRLERRQLLDRRKHSDGGASMATEAPPRHVMTAKSGTTAEKSLYDLIPGANCDDMRQLNRLQNQSGGGSSGTDKHKVNFCDIFILTFLT